MANFVKQQLIDILAEFDRPVYLQGSLSDTDAYPQSFFTFWNPNTTSGEFYDNDDHTTIWQFVLSFYSDDAEEVEEMLPNVNAALKSAGWIIDGVGYDALSDEPTHTGRSIDLIFIERKEQNSNV